jgi:hypothetical protein
LVSGLDFTGKTPLLLNVDKDEGRGVDEVPLVPSAVLDRF